MAIRLTVRKAEGQFVVDALSRPGSPPCGYGRTIKEALGDYLIANMGEVDVVIMLPGEVGKTYRRTKKRQETKNRQHNGF